MPIECDGCKFWSELIAQKIGLGPMEAMCLNPESHKYQHMVHDACSYKEEGPPIDLPY
jgi:hypothetical protein